MHRIGWLLFTLLLLVPVTSHPQDAGTSPVPPPAGQKDRSSDIEDALAYIKQGRPE
jgi:hypothetical protein